ncbi:MAG: hypothetical protein IT320_14510 [Anaerolineae bacterium]|nr:hypothetical protein [Anaerolineae bacterium]
METSLIVFYTYRLHGNLALLPRLYTFLRRMREQHTGAGRILLLDLGESCSADVFPCALTGGRSTLIALDAMGYDAANVSGQLSDEARQQLETLHFQTVLVEPGKIFQKGDLTATVEPGEFAASAGLCIDMNAAGETQLNGSVLQLAAVDQGQVGMAMVGTSEQGFRLTAARTLDVPGDLPHDPTIAGTVEFILSEARYLQRKQNVDAH